MYEPLDLVIFWLVFARGHYPVRPTDRTIVDVGANIGVFTLYAALQAPTSQVFAVEPFPNTFDRLMRLVEANHPKGRVHCLNLALAGTAGAAVMDTESGVPSQHRHIVSAVSDLVNAGYQGPVVAPELEGVTPPGPGAASATVRTQTPGQLLASESLVEGDLLKMNIHGSKYEVSLSTPPAVLQRIKRLLVQYHELPERLKLGKQQVFERLGAAGFDLTRDEDTGRGAGLAAFSPKCETL
ncbi:MAG TPA: FkbM family methyltransferase [Terriglobia bacterium]|nr:FkbM family methyltransferase [Terriglobia bacterium]